MECIQVEIYKDTGHNQTLLETHTVEVIPFLTHDAAVRRVKQAIGWSKRKCLIVRRYDAPVTEIRPYGTDSVCVIRFN